MCFVSPDDLLQTQHVTPDIPLQPNPLLVGPSDRINSLQQSGPELKQSFKKFLRESLKAQRPTQGKAIHITSGVDPRLSISLEGLIPVGSSLDNNCFI